MPTVTIYIYPEPTQRIEEWCPHCFKPSLEEKRFRVLNSQGVTDHARRLCRDCNTKWDEWPWPVTYRQ